MKKMNVQHRTSNIEHRIKERNYPQINADERGYIYFSFPCSSVGMHTIWVATREHGNQGRTEKDN